MPHSSPSYRPTPGELEARIPGLIAPGALPAPVRGLLLAAATAAQGRRDLTRTVLRALKAREDPPEAIREALLEVYLFAGYPRAINALAEWAVLAPVPTPEGVPLDLREEEAAWRRDGEALCRRIYGETYGKLLETMGRIHGDLGRWMILEGYGKVLSRPGLAPAVRELVAVAALGVLAVPDQLRAHLRGAFLIGAGRAEIEEALVAAAALDPAGEAEGRRLLEEVAHRYDRSRTV